MSDQYTAGSEVFDGRYRLERIIGTGGMAIVWCATDQRLGRRVAIKVIADTLAADPAYVERFAREARTAAGLSHPHLVSVYDFAASASQPFLVMQLVEGGTLADRIARGPVAAREARALATDLTAALGCVHQAGILHRDIKPANVLIGSDGRARLTDFGIAQPEDATRADPARRCHRHDPLPRAGGPRRRDARPSRATSTRSASWCASSSAENADPELQAFVGRLTATDPADRPAGAGEALALLSSAKAATRSMPGPAADADAAVPRPAAAATTPPSGARRHVELRLTPAIAIGAAVAVMLLALVILSAGGSGRAGESAPTPARPAARPPRARSRRPVPQHRSPSSSASTSSTSSSVVPVADAARPATNRT